MYVHMHTYVNIRAAGAGDRELGCRIAAYFFPFLLFYIWLDRFITQISDWPKPWFGFGFCQNPKVLVSTETHCQQKPKPKPNLGNFLLFFIDIKANWAHTDTNNTDKTRILRSIYLGAKKWEVIFGVYGSRGTYEGTNQGTKGTILNETLLLLPRFPHKNGIFGRYLDFRIGKMENRGTNSVASARAHFQFSLYYLNLYRSKNVTDSFFFCLDW